MKFSLLHQVMQAWKRHTRNEKKARAFRAINYEAELLKHTFDLLTGNNVVNQFHRIAESRLNEMHNARLMRQAYNALTLNSKYGAISEKMR